MGKLWLLKGAYHAVWGPRARPSANAQSLPGAALPPGKSRSRPSHPSSASLLPLWRSRTILLIPSHKAVSSRQPHGDGSEDPVRALAPARVVSAQRSFGTGEPDCSTSTSTSPKAGRSLYEQQFTYRIPSLEPGPAQGRERLPRAVVVCISTLRPRSECCATSLR